MIVPNLSYLYNERSKQGRGSASRRAAFKISGVFTPPAAPVPALSPVGLATLLLVLAGTTLVLVRRRLRATTRP